MDLNVGFEDLEYTAKKSKSLFLAGNDLTAGQLKAMLVFAGSLHDKKNPIKDEIEAISLYEIALSVVQSKGSSIFISSEELEEYQSRVAAALLDADLFLAAGLQMRSESDFKGAKAYLIKAKNLGHPDADRWLKGTEGRILDSNYATEADHDALSAAFFELSWYNNTAGAIFRNVIVFTVTMHMLPMGLLGITVISYLQSDLGEAILKTIGCENKVCLMVFCILSFRIYQDSGDSQYVRDIEKNVAKNVFSCGLCYICDILHSLPTCNCPYVCLTSGFSFPRQQLEALRGDFNILTEEGTFGKPGGKKSTAITIFMFFQILSGFVPPCLLSAYYSPGLVISTAYFVWWTSFCIIVCFHEFIIWRGTRDIDVKAIDVEKKIRSTIFAIDRRFNMKLCNLFGIDAIDVPDIYVPLWLYPLVSLFPSVVAAFAVQTWLLYRFQSDYFEIASYFAGNVYATGGVIKIVGSYILNYVCYSSGAIGNTSTAPKRGSRHLAAAIAARHKQRHGKGIQNSGNDATKDSTMINPFHSEPDMIRGDDIEVGSKSLALVSLRIE